MTWNLEEKVEDAILAYLSSTVEARIKFFTAFSDVPIEYPCVVVKAESSQPVSGEALEHPYRDLVVSVAAISEAAPEQDEQGQIITTTRDRNAQIRAAVLDVICIPDLVARINALPSRECIFTQCQFQRMTRSVEGRHLMSVIELFCIANP